jgi:hypothetical protein
MAMKELRIPLLNNAPWYERPGSKVPIVRTGENSFRLGDWPGESNFVRAQAEGLDNVLVFAVYLQGFNRGRAAPPYLFALSDWQRRLELDIISPE